MLKWVCQNFPDGLLFLGDFWSVHTLTANTAHNPLEWSYNSASFSPTPSFRQGIPRVGLNFGKYLSSVFPSSEILHCQCSACLAALTSVKVVSQQWSTSNRKKETGWQMKLYFSYCKLAVQTLRLTLNQLCTNRSGHKFLFERSFW